MAKKSMVAREKKRALLVERYVAKRAKYKAVLIDQNASFDEKMEAQRQLQTLPRDSSASRRRNRCRRYRRPRAAVGRSCIRTHSLGPGRRSRRSQPDTRSNQKDRDYPHWLS